MTKTASLDFPSENSLSHMEELAACMSPAKDDSSEPGEFIGSLRTHSWSLQNSRRMKGLGVIVRYRCLRCHLEWSNILVEEKERLEGMEYLKESGSQNPRPRFEY